jgi:Piwi domain.
MCAAVYGMSTSKPASLAEKRAELEPILSTAPMSVSRSTSRWAAKNQRLEPSQLGIFADGKTMLVGLDVTHPSPGSAGTAPSVAAIVASIDSHLAQWPAEIRIQKARQEMVDDLEALLKSRILRWGKSNQTGSPRT